MSWNISIENGQATINLSVEQDAAGRALIAATAAEAAASNAETASTQAGESASESAASATAAGQSATNALSSEQAAASSASQAAGSATAASANATAAGQSATEAESSATAATGSATAAAQSEINAAGSATAASQSASNALASEQNAAQSETNAATSASTATTQAGIATTKAGEASQAASEALGSAQAAAQSEAEAEAARDEIVSKIDFTEAQEGDLYRVNSAGVAVRINETEFLKSKVPFLNSPLAGLIDLDNVFAWDSFNRPNTSATLTTDSGNNYIQFSGSSGLRIENNYAYKNNFSDIIGINTGFGSVRFINNVRIRPANSNNSFVIGKDANNYVLYQHNPTFGDGIRVSIVIAGVETLLSAQSYFLVFGLSSAQLVANSAVVTFIIDLIRPSEGGMVLRINCPTIPNLNQSVDLSSYRASDYPNASDIAFVGWGFGNNSERTGIRSWSVSNIIT